MEFSSRQEGTPERARVLSGMRPTGRLHLGNYMGALYNWVKLQHEYECYFFIADYHALTTDYADTGKLEGNMLEVALDFLAAGLDPNLCTLFIQGEVKEHFELFTLLAMITPVPWLERVPTYKDQQEQLKEKDLATFGFLGYPLLQTADILLYKPKYVPVGQDQAAHVEITREVARRFNSLYPGKFMLSADAAPWEMEAVKAKARKIAGLPEKQVFSTHELVQAAHQTKLKSTYVVEQILPEPDVLLTPSPKLPGMDGRKMSKSYKNTIELSESETEVRLKLKTMVTDPERIRRGDPGNPEVCPVGDLHKVFSTDERRLEVWEGCTTAGIGCIECKGWLADAVVELLAPIQERRRHYETRPDEVNAIFADGCGRATQRAAQTMKEVRRAVGLRG